MYKYIEREQLVQWLKKAGSFLKVEQDHKRVCYVIGKIIDHIEAMPAADVTEVVKCRDCKYLMFSDFYGECKCNHLGIVSPYDFCSRSARMDREGDVDNG